MENGCSRGKMRGGSDVAQLRSFLKHCPKGIKRAYAGGAYDLWKKLKGYGKRSLVETFFSRLKTLLGECLSSRKPTHQELESLMKIYASNQI